MNRGRYMAIPPGAVIPGALPDFRIYVLTQQGSYRLWALEGKRVTSEQLAKLSEGGCTEVYVDLEEQFKYEQYLESNLGSILSFLFHRLRDRRGRGENVVGIINASGQATVRVDQKIIHQPSPELERLFKAVHKALQARPQPAQVLVSVAEKAREVPPDPSPRVLPGETRPSPWRSAPPYPHAP